MNFCFCMEAVLSRSWKFRNFSFLELCCDYHLVLAVLESFGQSVEKSSDTAVLWGFFYSIHHNAGLLWGNPPKVLCSEHAPNFSTLQASFHASPSLIGKLFSSALLTWGNTIQIKERKNWCFLLLRWSRKSCYIRVYKLTCVADRTAGWCFIFLGAKRLSPKSYAAAWRDLSVNISYCVYNETVIYKSSCITSHRCNRENEECLMKGGFLVSRIAGI